jgi:hypothetical protein
MFCLCILYNCLVLFNMIIIIIINLKALPEGMLMTKDARCAFVRAAGIFVFYLTHCSNDFCRESKRQTIYTQDVINALK